MNLLWKTLFAGLVACFVASGAYASDYRIYCDPKGWIDSPPGKLVAVRATRIFNSDRANDEDLGPGANLTGIEWSTLDYTDTDQIHGLLDGGNYDRGSFIEILDRVYHETLSEDALNALDDPPPSPFKIVATVSMENDDGKTATCDFEFRSSYTIEPDEPDEPEQATAPADPPGGPTPVQPPTLKVTETNAPPGVTSTIFPEFLFDNPGTNLRFTDVEFDTTEYYNMDRTGFSAGLLEVTAKTEEELEALLDPPNLFRVRVTISVRNDEGATGSGTVLYKTEW